MPDVSASPASAHLLRLVRVVRGLTALGALSLLLLPPVFWLSPGWLESQAAEWTQVAGGHFTLDARARLLVAAAMLPALAVALWTLWQLWLLFGEYQAGRVFGRPAVRWLQRFAHGLLATALLAPVVRTGLVLAVTLGNPPGQRQLVLSLDSADFFAVLVAAVLSALAAVMAHAAALAEDNAGFV